MYHRLLLISQLFIVTATLESCLLKYLIETLGYSFRYSVEEPNTPHNSFVTAYCGEEHHKFKCNDGNFEPIDSSKSICKGSCPLKYLSETLGYSFPYSVGDSNTPHNSIVTAYCGKEYHKLKCNNGDFEQIYPSTLTKVCKASQCAPLTVEPPTDGRLQITLTYDKDPDPETNKYPNGTNVTFSCPPHYPIGVDEYGVCINGKWMTLMNWEEWQPTLPGSCQRQCDAEKLLKEKGYEKRYKGDASKYLDENYRWVESGTKISVFCPTSLIKVGWHYWTCRDAYWLPENSNYDKCTYW